MTLKEFEMYWYLGLFVACGVGVLLGYVAVAGRVWRHLGPFFTNTDPMFERFELFLRLLCTIAWPGWLALRVAGQLVVVIITFTWQRGVRGLVRLAAAPFVTAWRVWGGAKPRTRTQAPGSLPKAYVVRDGAHVLVGVTKPLADDFVTSGKEHK